MTDCPRCARMEAVVEAAREAVATITGPYAGVVYDISADKVDQLKAALAALLALAKGTVTQE